MRVYRASAIVRRVTEPQEWTPHRVIAARMKELRKRHGWTAEQLAEKLTAVGIKWDRSIVSNVETGRRASITVEEMMALAMVLDTSPVHMMVPLEDRRAIGDTYAVTKATKTVPSLARRWVRGQMRLGPQDRRLFYSEVPVDEYPFLTRAPTMASVSKRIRDGRTTYVVRWRDDDGRQRKLSFAREVDADRKRADVEHSLNSGSYIDPRAGLETFRAYADRWRAAQPHRPNTAARIASQCNARIYPALGARSLASIRPSDVQAFVTGLSVDLKPSSVRAIATTVRSVFRAALDDRVIGIDPTVRIRMPQVPRQQIVPLSVEQVRALMRQCQRATGL